MVWRAFIVGSAGHGKGIKKKSANGSLGVVADEGAAMRYFGKYDCQVEGSYVVKGCAGYAGHALKELEYFFQKCKKNNWDPIVYYTGHGASDGSWCFPDENLSPKQIQDCYNEHGPSRYAVLFNDCCYAGQWLWHARNRGQAWHVICASDHSTLGDDNRFSEAVFKSNASEGTSLRTENKAIAMLWSDDNSCEVVYFNGTMRNLIQPAGSSSRSLKQVSIAGGTNPGASHLSCRADGYVDLYRIDDRSGRQRWKFIKQGNWYNILVEGGTNAGRLYLSCRADGLVDLYSHDDGSGRQRWLLEEIRSGVHNIKIQGGTNPDKKYLSCRADGFVDLYGRDDLSGRQQWRLTNL